LLGFTFSEVLNDPFNSNKTRITRLCLPIGREVFPAGLFNATVGFIVAATLLVFPTIGFEIFGIGFALGFLYGQKSRRSLFDRFSS
jgi:hypothetical protein